MASPFPRRWAILYPMFPASRLGKTRMLALPATSDPGALAAATDGTIAASNCSSPSSMRSGASRWAFSVASRMRAVCSFTALPMVEKDSIATRGSLPMKARQLSAVCTAIWASSSAFG